MLVQEDNLSNNQQIKSQVQGLKAMFINIREDFRSKDIKTNLFIQFFDKQSKQYSGNGGNFETLALSIKQKAEIIATQQQKIDKKLQKIQNYLERTIFLIIQSGKKVQIANEERQQRSRHMEQHFQKKCQELAQDNKKRLQQIIQNLNKELQKVTQGLNKRIQEVTQSFNKRLQEMKQYFQEQMQKINEQLQNVKKLVKSRNFYNDKIDIDQIQKIIEIRTTAIIAEANLKYTTKQEMYELVEQSQKVMKQKIDQNQQAMQKLKANQEKIEINMENRLKSIQQNNNMILQLLGSGLVDKLKK